MASAQYCMNRMREFKERVSQLPRALRGSKCAPFIEIVIGDLKMSTYDSLNYFMQLDISYAGTGTGEANQFTVTLAYLPRPIDRVNFIDEALSGVTAENRPCMIRYGYSGIPGYNLLSSQYEVLVLGYSLQVRDNYLYYTINLVSTGVKWREKRFNFGRAKDIDPINWIYQCWQSVEGLKDEYLLVIDQDAYGHVEKIDFGYKKDSNTGNIIDETFTMNDVTVFEFLDSIFMELVDTDDATAYYWYEIIDVKDQKQIAIHRTLISEDSIVSWYGNSEQIIFTFDWGGNHQDDSTNNLILGFDTDYKGEVNIATVSNIATARSIYDSSGTMIEANGLEDYQVGDYVKQDFASTTKFWAKSVNWAYTAQLEIVGVPADIPIGGYIEVNPLIYGQKHHTAGVYMITGAKANITSGGFVTNLELVKVVIPKAGSWYSQLPRKIYEHKFSTYDEGYVDLIVAVTNNEANRDLIANDPKTYSGPDKAYIPLSDAQLQEYLNGGSSSGTTTYTTDYNIYTNRNS